MPQMAPLNWTILFIYFSLIFLMFMFINYYIFSYSPPSMYKKTSFKNNLNWKW